MTPHVLVLAGGVGKRFYPFVQNKTMFPVMGKPLLEHTFLQLARCGFTDILVAVNEQNKSFVETYSHPKLNITAKKQPEAAGMADAVLLFKQELTGTPTVVINAIDFLDDQVFLNILKLPNESYAAVTGIEQSAYFPGGYLEIQDNRAISVVEKPGEGKEPSKLVKLVVDYFSKPEDLVAQFESVPSDKDDVYEQALNKLMKEKEVLCVPYNGYWQAVKYPFHILAVMERYLGLISGPNISDQAEIAESAHISGHVYIEAGARIFENAIVKGPAYIGKNVIVGDNASVRESVVEEGSIVGFGSEVTRSYVGPGCMLHHNFVGDSVLESNVNPSYGTCFANMRFDGKPVSIKSTDGQLVPTGRQKFGAVVADHAFLGINTSVLPGRTISAGATTHPGSVVSKNI